MYSIALPSISEFNQVKIIKSTVQIFMKKTGGKFNSKMLLNAFRNLHWVMLLKKKIEYIFYYYNSFISMVILP